MPGSSYLEQRLRGRLAELETGSLLRSLQPPAGIDLSSNDYLGLSKHPLLRQSMAEAIAREGCGSTGSRLLRGDRESYTRLEARFAAFKAAGRSLYFSSGYLANLAVLTTFAEPGDIEQPDVCTNGILSLPTTPTRGSVLGGARGDQHQDQKRPCADVDVIV